MSKNCFLLGAGSGAAAMVLACSASAGTCLFGVTPNVVNNDDCSTAGAAPGYIDPNGGCNFPDGNPFQDIGTIGVPSTTNIVGTVGTYIPFGGDDFTSRDLDWYTFTLNDCAEVTLTLRMNNRFDVGGAIGFDESIMFLAANGGTCPVSGLMYAQAGFSCSHVAGPFTLSAGTYTFIVTLPFETAGSDPYPIYNCPAPYEAIITANPLTFGAGICGSNGSCTETWPSGGCTDCECCSLVCSFDFDCCTVAWDADCVNLAVELCGLFVYDCDPDLPGAPANNCATNATLVQPGDIVCVSTIGATTDGPNGGASLCTFDIGDDVWYMMQAPSNGELNIVACGLSGFDAAMAVYNIGDSPVFNPEDFLNFPGACVDDTCGEVAGPPQITLVNVIGGNYYLIRIGSWFDAETPAGQGTGIVSFNFNQEIFSPGIQKPITVLATGALTNLGLSSGFQLGAFTQRWSAVPFSVSGGMPWSVEAIIGKGFIPDGVVNDRLCWAIWERSGQSLPGSMVAEGCCCQDGEGTWVLPFNYDDPEDGAADSAWRISMTDELMLPAGDYYLTIYGSNGDPSLMQASNWAWFIYALDGIQMVDPSLGRFGYRSENPGPDGGFVFYQGLEGVYEVQAGDDPNALYTNAFDVLGRPSCHVTGDRNGSGSVDGADLSIVLGQWDPTGAAGNGYGPGDANCDGKVDGADLSVVLGQWQPIGCQ